jgi:predicted SnoaL-like aldol condensation-catalyzing enzyme
MAGAALALALALTATTQAQAAAMSNKDIAIAFYNAFNQGDIEGLRRYGHDSYIQHNPAATTGLPGLIDYLRARQRPPGAAVPGPLEFVRTIAEGDMVMLQRRVAAPTPEDPQRVGSIIDIYRVQDGKVAEHWDYFEYFTKGDQRGAEAPRNANGVF